MRGRYLGGVDGAAANFRARSGRVAVNAHRSCSSNKEAQRCLCGVHQDELAVTSIAGHGWCFPPNIATKGAFSTMQSKAIRHLILFWEALNLVGVPLLKLITASMCLSHVINALHGSC